MLDADPANLADIASFADPIPTATKGCPRRVLFVGWDAADEATLQPLLTRGVLPNLKRLMAEGVFGEIATLYPTTPTILWNSVVTGMTADQHGMTNRVVENADCQGIHAVGPADRRAPALWDIIGGPDGVGRCHVINFPGSHPAYSVGGLTVSDAAARDLCHGPGGAPLAALPGTFASPNERNSPAERDASAIWDDLRMGCADLNSDIIARFLPGPLPVPALLPPTLAACFTVHNYATAALETDDWDFAAVCYPGLLPFAQIANTVNTPTALAQSLLQGAARLHDLFLGRLVELTRHDGRPTTIVFAAPQGVPTRATGFAGEETDARAGIFVLSGDGIQLGGRRLAGARIIDLAPTTLALLSIAPLTVGLPGRPLRPALLPEVTAAWIVDPAPSYSVAAHADTVPIDSPALLAQLARNGLVSPLYTEAGGEKLAEAARRQRLWTLARVYDGDGRSAKALEILEPLYNESKSSDSTEQARIAIVLAETLLNVGRGDEAAVILEPLHTAAQHNETPANDIKAHACLLLARHSVETGHIPHGQALLAEAAHDPGASALLLIQVAYALLCVKRVDIAFDTFTRASQLDPEHSLPWAGRAGCDLFRHRNADALADADRSIALHHGFGLVHWIRARALRALGRESEALDAYGAALRLGLSPLETADSRRILTRAGRPLPITEK